MLLIRQADRSAYGAGASAYCSALLTRCERQREQKQQESKRPGQGREKQGIVFSAYAESVPQFRNSAKNGNIGVPIPIWWFDPDARFWRLLRQGRAAQVRRRSGTAPADPH